MGKFQKKQSSPHHSNKQKRHGSAARQHGRSTGGEKHKSQSPRELLQQIIPEEGKEWWTLLPAGQVRSTATSSTKTTTTTTETATKAAETATSGAQAEPIAVHQLEQLQDRAKRLLHEQELEYGKFMSETGGSDWGWLLSMLKQGTTKNRLGALTVMVQRSPAHSVKALDLLLTSCKKPIHQEAEQAIVVMKELFLNQLLPSDRALRFFRDSIQLYSQDVSNATLLLCQFEDVLKQHYDQYLSALDQHAHSALLHMKRKAIRCLYELIVAKPEQDLRILRLLLNKLGDPERKIASDASYLLQQLVNTHSNMRAAVAEETHSFIETVAINQHKAQYYAVIFLNQIMLTQRDVDLACKLVRIYFKLFETMLENRKQDMDPRMLSAILTGVNRAFPFAQAKLVQDELFDSQIDTLFQLVHRTPLPAAVQAMLLLYQVMEGRQVVSDRFYTALYSLLNSSSLLAAPVSKPGLFLNLIMKSLSHDPSTARIAAMIKRLLQLCFHQQPHFICSALLLISEVMRKHPSLALSISKSESQLSNSQPLTLDTNTNADADSNSNSVTATDSTAAATSPSVYYDPRKRNPQFAHAETTCFFELNVLAQHYHPSVASFAKSLLAVTPIVYHGNPLEDFALHTFFERFVFKKPKKEAADHGTSLMQRRATAFSATEAPVNTQEFLKTRPEDVRVEEMFFYKYFHEKRKRETEANQRKKAKKSEAYEDNEAADATWLGDDADADEGDEEYDYDRLDAIPSEDEDELESRFDEKAAEKELIRELEEMDDSHADAASDSANEDEDEEQLPFLDDDEDEDDDDFVDDEADEAADDLFPSFEDAEESHSAAAAAAAAGRKHKSLRSAATTRPSTSSKRTPAEKTDDKSGGGNRKKRPSSVFASVDDYSHLLNK